MWAAPRRRERTLYGKSMNPSPNPSLGTPGEEDLELANEVHIPDYVMLDFGSCRRSSLP